MSADRGAALRRVRVVAEEEYRRALETRWLFAFTALFALLVFAYERVRLPLCVLATAALAQFWFLERRIHYQ